MITIEIMISYLTSLSNMAVTEDFSARLHSCKIIRFDVFGFLKILRLCCNDLKLLQKIVSPPSFYMRFVMLLLITIAMVVMLIIMIIMTFLPYDVH